MDITTHKMVDIYTGKVLRYSTVDELLSWLKKSYATLTEQQEEMIKFLGISFESGDEQGIKWYGAACGLDITPKKRTRRKKT